MQPEFLLYGATGYTGELMARAAVRHGLRPVLAGRNADSLKRLADELSLSYRAFALDDPAVLDAGLAGIGVVLNCAGPFVYTAQKLAVACLRVHAHYLDIAGEVPEFQALQALDAQAQEAQVMLLPGVGFGIVPSDALALHLKTLLPSAIQLSLAFQAVGGVSRGTLLTTLKDLPHPGVTRRNGELVPTRAGAETRRIDFGQGVPLSCVTKHAWDADLRLDKPQRFARSAVACLVAAFKRRSQLLFNGRLAAVTNPWRGDIFTAYYSTGIPTIKAYTVYPAPFRILMALSVPLKGILSSTAFQNFLQRQAQRQPAGPSAEERARGKTVLWGEVVDAHGRRAISRLAGPEAYDFTVSTALSIVQRVLNGEVRPGFSTPSQVYGADFVLSIPGVERIDEI